MHRIFKAALRGQPSPYTRDELLAIASTTEQAGRQARQVETETDTYWILRHLEGRAGETLDALVLRPEARRTLVELQGFGFTTPIAPRPDHVKGKHIHVRVRASKPRRGLLTLEELAP